jgi:hypothetical protein
VTWNSSVYPESALRELDECIFFLKHGADADTYIPHGGPFGIFLVVNATDERRRID